jgi:hypothetical protein
VTVAQARIAAAGYVGSGSDAAPVLARTVSTPAWREFAGDGQEVRAGEVQAMASEQGEPLCWAVLPDWGRGQALRMDGSGSAVQVRQLWGVERPGCGMSVVSKVPSAISRASSASLRWWARA